MDKEISHETLASVFSRLKLYSVDLLELLRNPKKDASFLPEMAKFLRGAPSDALQPYLDFTLFPLLLLLDAAVKCRSEKKGDLRDPFGGLMIGDYVAENMLMCLEEILKKCDLGSVNQMVVVLKKLTSGALLSPSEAAEEFREGIIRCLREMLLRVQPCSIASCSCKQTSRLSTVIVKSLEPPSILKHPMGAECLVAFLQSQNASAAVGHLLSLLLQAAEVEAARGHLGSGRLRKEAFLTLRVLVAKVGSADALGFFLPGIVSRFSKALHVSKSMVSGAAGNTGSIEHAVRGLTEFLMIVLSDDANHHVLDAPCRIVSGCSQNDNKTTESVLDALRHLPAGSQAELETVAGSSLCQSMMVYPCNDVFQDKAGEDGTSFLYVHRTKHWINETSTNVDRVLSAIFPHLCTNPSEKIRKGLVDGIKGLLFNCSYTLRRSKLMLLVAQVGVCGHLIAELLAECLCVLVYDDLDAVSVTALESLESLFMLEKKFLSENEISEIFTRLIEKLPIVVFGSDETVAVSHARKLLALIYYAGPELVVDQLLCSPVKAARFFECFELALSHNSRYAGNVNNLVLSKPLSVGYLLSISELKSGSTFNYSSDSFARGVPSIVPMIAVLEDKSMENSAASTHGDSEFPHMPPWFVHIGGQKLYQAIAGILRLVGLSIVADRRSEVSLSSIIDIPLEFIYKLILELRMKNCSKVGWQMWCSQSASGQLLRQCSTAVHILNEMIYGLSDQSVALYMKMFRKTGRRGELAETKELIFNWIDQLQYNSSIWKLRQGLDTRSHIIHCIGRILHVYLSPEVWDLPINQNTLLVEHDVEANVPLHFFRDVATLQQVIMEGIGISSIILGRDFLSSGFMHSCLFLLLQNLISSNNQIRAASDAVLQFLSVATGYSTVGHLVVANADYVIDALCRQLRHLDLNPNIPYVLAAMLSFVGAAHDILPLLEEPMQAVCLELEVLGRHQHPNLTLPFLQAMGEMCKASRREASKLTSEAESFSEHICFKLNCMQNRGEVKDSQNSHSSMCFEIAERNCIDVSDVGLQLEHWEELLFKLHEMKRYRRTVGSLVGSCLNAATPLLGSLKESACLGALNIIEDATISLAEVERAYKVEKETKVAIEEAIQLCLRSDLQDNMDASDEDTEENRLLPAMNRIWPYLILCLKNKVSVAVIRRCTSVISKVIQISGGDFFVRRFHIDGPVIWKILASSPLRGKPLPSKDEKLILLPYRSSTLSPGDQMAETSSLKVQAAVLNMIGEIASNTKSAPAMQAVLRKVSGLVVGIACSSVTGLRDASFRAVAGLASIDPDLIWLLLADVYYAMKSKSNTVSAPAGLASISEILPAPSASKDYLYVQYAGEGLGFDVDPVSVETVFQKLQTEALTM